MPVIIPEARESEWCNDKLSVNEVKSFFSPFDEKLMDAYEVNRELIA